MGNENQTLLEVEGMTCSSCVRHVKEALQEVEGVSAVDVRLREGRVLVSHSKESEVERMVDALRDAGYEASRSAA